MKPLRGIGARALAYGICDFETASSIGVAGVERSEPPVQEIWGLVALDPSHPP